MDQPTESDVFFAEHLVLPLCPIDWAEGRGCLSCHNKVSLPQQRVGGKALTAAGRSEGEILNLEPRYQDGAMAMIILTKEVGPMSCRKLIRSCWCTRRRLRLAGCAVAATSSLARSPSGHAHKPAGQKA
jgi:hypothetical protein